MADRRLLPGFPRSGSAVVDRLRELARTAPTKALETAGLSVASAAERVIKRVDRITETVERSAEMQRQILGRLGPVINDLGKLIRVQLDQAQRVQDEAKKKAAAQRSEADSDPNIIDTEEV